MRIAENPFYTAYERQGLGVTLKKKHVRQFEIDFVKRSEYQPSLSVLELGCGNGLFLQFLQSIGSTDFKGIDGDPRVLDEMSESIGKHVQISDFDDYFSTGADDKKFDRIVLFDVLEHFSTDDALSLMKKIHNRLSADGRVVLRVPNMSSPLAMPVQYNDITHLSTFNPGALGQLGMASGYSAIDIFPQAYGTLRRELKEKALTSVVSWFLAQPPKLWSPAIVAVLHK